MNSTVVDESLSSYQPMYCSREYQASSVLFFYLLHSGVFYFKVPLLVLYHGDFLILGCNGDVIQILGAINMISLKFEEPSTHSTVTFSFVDIVFLRESIVTDIKLT